MAIGGQRRACPLRPNEATPTTEADVGIQEFLCPDVGGFSGRFKERWEDFQVYEVSQDGCELHLAELITPGAVAAELRQASASRREARAALGPGFSPEPEAEAELRQALGNGCLEEFVDFLRKQLPPGARTQEVDVAAQQVAGESPATAAQPPGFLDLDAGKIGDGSKESRKRAHQALLGHFSFLNTETVEADGARCIRVWMREAEKRAKGVVGSPDTSLRGGDAAGKGSGKGSKGGKGKRGGKKGSHGKGNKSDSGAVVHGGEDVSKQTGNEFGTLRRDAWPKDRHDFLYFRLYKENCDTGEAVANIARCVGRSPKLFRFAGTKDRRAVTVQHVSAYRLPADQLRRTVLHRNWDRRVRISSLEYRPARLRLGQLRGNRFAIALRGVGADATTAKDGAPSAVQRAFAKVAEGGFLNYYGMQRFGTFGVLTHRIGVAIIAGRWADAVHLLLGAEDAPCKEEEEEVEEEDAGHEAVAPPPAKRARLAADGPPPGNGKGADDDSAMRAGGSGKDSGKWQQGQQALQIFLKTGNAQAALEAMPRFRHLERCVLGALARGLPPQQVLRQLPHQALSLYVHAAQSLLWNAVVSHRIRHFGPRPVVGDLVLEAAGDGAAEPVDCSEALDGEIGPSLDEDAEAGPEEEEEDPYRLPAVRELSSAEEAAAADLCTVVLPLPGTEVQYPRHLRQVYEELAQSLLGLSLESFHSTTFVPLTGAYRCIAARPRGLEWRIRAPAELRGQQALLTTDVARLLAERSAAADGDASPGHNHVATEDTEVTSAETSCPPRSDGKAEEAEQNSAAVTFTCELPPSTYLTMLLREVMKLPTTGLAG